ncbi:50S ribosomal protein L24 [Candidatus Dojkabacteria bacterium]|nr:50S ribosomal protein L24 [Candidatus Dojkabacteria bacterium]
MSKIRKGDTVQIMRGKDSGKRGEVLALVDDAKIVVRGINVVKRARKPNPQLGIKGGLVEVEKAIDVSNVMLIDPKTDKPTRVGFKVDEKTGKKVRFAKKSGELLK